MEVNDTQIATLETALRDEVRKLATDAARWYLDGNADEETYRRVLKGIEDGDPMILDDLPWLSWGGDELPDWGGFFYDIAPDIVGDYPDNDPLMASLEDKYLEVIGTDYANEVLLGEVERICCYHLGEE